MVAQPGASIFRVFDNPRQMTPSDQGACVRFRYAPFDAEQRQRSNRRLLPNLKISFTTGRAVWKDYPGEYTVHNDPTGKGASSSSCVGLSLIHI